MSLLLKIVSHAINACKTLTHSTSQIIFYYNTHHSFLTEVTAVYQEPTYTVEEDNPVGLLTACVAIVSPATNSLATSSSVQITFADGPAPSASMSK